MMHQNCMSWKVDGCSHELKIVKEKGESKNVLGELTCGSAAALVSGCAGQGRWGGVLGLDISESCDYPLCFVVSNSENTSLSETAEFFLPYLIPLELPLTPFVYYQDFRVCEVRKLIR